jgi:RimJ/RimL family protein N-acetyltransferase
LRSLSKEFDPTVSLPGSVAVVSAAALPSCDQVSFHRMTADDLEDMASLLGSPEVMAFYPAPKTRSEAAGWIAWNQSNYARDGFGLWVIRNTTGAFVGDCGLTWQTVDGVTDLEIGFHVRPAFQGQGLATAAAAACRDFAQRRGISRLIAIINPANRPSQRVAEKLGMRLEQDTVWRDGRPIRVYAMGL